MSSETFRKKEDPRTRPVPTMPPMSRFVLSCIFVLVLGCFASMAISESSPSLHRQRLSENIGYDEVTARRAKRSGLRSEAMSFTPPVVSPSSVRVSSEMASAKLAPPGATGTLGESFSEQMDLSLDKLKASDSKRSLDPMLVHTGSMAVGVKKDNFDSFEKQLDSIVRDTGNGYFQDKTHERRGTSHPSIHVTIRVESNKFDRVIEEIRSAENVAVTSLSTSTLDVTDEYVDASARADVLEAARTSLQTLLSRADTVDDILKLQKELKTLTESAESLRQRALSLKKSSEYSTLTLDVYTKAEPRDDSKDIPPDGMLRPYHVVLLALDQINALFIICADLLVYVVVWSVPLGLFVAVAYYLCANGAASKPTTQQ